MEKSSAPHRAKSKIVNVTLTGTVADRFERARTARNPAPPASALVRALVEQALPGYEAALGPGVTL